MSSASPSCPGHRYPVEVISHCVWLYFRFPLSFRGVEELMLERGVLVSYETVRRWYAKFGRAHADGPRRRRPRPGDQWHPDEVFITINGDQKYLWRAVDQDGTVLDILMQIRRDTAAARRCFRRLLKTTRTLPRVIITDRLRSYRTAHRQVTPSVEHRSHKGLDNRAENSHQPARRRERAMKGFRSVGAAHRFLSAFSGISPHFRPRRHLMTASGHRAEMTTASRSGTTTPQRDNAHRQSNTVDRSHFERVQISCRGCIARTGRSLGEGTAWGGGFRVGVWHGGRGHAHGLMCGWVGRGGVGCGDPGGSAHRTVDQRVGYVTDVPRGSHVRQCPACWMPAASHCDDPSVLASGRWAFEVLSEEGDFGTPDEAVTRGSVILPRSADGSCEVEA